jgi:uncharacterized protein YwqG
MPRFRCFLLFPLLLLSSACSRNELPRELEEYRPRIEASKLDYIKVIARASQGTKPWESKFLGTPYRLKGEPWPQGKDGSPLVLLAQINFAEMPALAGYPESGLLQFFIAGVDDIFGMGHYQAPAGQPFDGAAYFESLLDQANFRVKFHPTVAADTAKLDVTAPAMGEVFLPVINEARLSFDTDAEYVQIWDYRFASIFGRTPDDLLERFGARATDVANGYIKFSTRQAQAKIGGYGSFVQEDPRVHRQTEDWLILLEIRSSGEHGVDILWGDAGIGVFMIRREDLRRRDFSRVAYYWDNH